jgi:hypothetical protein
MRNGSFNKSKEKEKRIIMKNKPKINITTIRKFDKYNLLTVLQILNSWKRKVKWLASLNPFMLFIGYVIFMIIPYIPNIPLYLILLNKRVNKWVKWLCLTISIIFTVVYNIFIIYYIFK